MDTVIIEERFEKLRDLLLYIEHTEDDIEMIQSIAKRNELTIHLASLLTSE